MSIVLPGVLSQRVYPGVGDIDDCAAIATIYAATSADPLARKPTITEFRLAAGKPDKPGPTGMNVDDIARAAPIIWPGQPFVRVRTESWQILMGHLDRAAWVSVALLSSALPARLRFGFGGPHQIAVVKRGGVIYAMNPLARDGSAPLPITETELRVAVRALASGWILAGVFPRVPRWRVRVLPGWWGRFWMDHGTLRRHRQLTGGFDVACDPPILQPWGGKVRKLVRLTEGRWRGSYANRGALNVRARRIDV